MVYIFYRLSKNEYGVCWGFFLICVVLIEEKKCIFGIKIKKKVSFKNLV